ncbi:MAG: metallophosphoesterase [Clostridia bacterium]|nr:metallophosphoesterase [Clostridia bacterium]
MSRIKYIPLRVLSLIVAVIVVLAYGKFGGETFDIREPEKSKLNFTILSDVHVETNNWPRYPAFTRGLQNVNKNKSGNDLILFLGDEVMCGQYFENVIFHGLTSLFLRNETILPVLGNHDAGNGDGDPAKIMKRWYRFTDAFFDLQLDHPYYYKVVNGCYFIILGSEAEKTDECVYSDTQLAWLEDTLTLAAESGKPAFVIAHFPLHWSRDENLQPTWRPLQIMQDYYREHDLFFLCGHHHTPLQRDQSFRFQNGIPQIYSPSLSQLDNEGQMTEKTGEGIIVEMYEDSVTFRGRNFVRSEWVFDDEDTPCERTYTLNHPIAE